MNLLLELLQLNEAITESDPSARMMEIADRLKMKNGQLGKAKLKSCIDDKTMIYNFTKAKSVWSGKTSKDTSPEGILIYISPTGDPDRFFEYDEKTLRGAGSSVDELKALFKTLGLKRNSKMFQVYA